MYNTHTPIIDIMQMLVANIHNLLYHMSLTKLIISNRIKNVH